MFYQDSTLRNSLVIPRLFEIILQFYKIRPFSALGLGRLYPKSDPGYYQFGKWVLLYNWHNSRLQPTTLLIGWVIDLKPIGLTTDYHKHTITYIHSTLCLYLTIQNCHVLKVSQSNSWEFHLATRTLSVTRSFFELIKIKTTKSCVISRPTCVNNAILSIICTILSWWTDLKKHTIGRIWQCLS